MTKPTFGNWIALICLGAIWGGSFMGAKLALISFGPMTIALLRVSLASIVLLDYNNSFRKKVSQIFNTNRSAYLVSYYLNGAINQFNTFFPY
jgi:drug/metabolite transporter (DMT)-like permease